MNNQEAIKAMRNLDDVISITASEHEAVRLAIETLEKQIPKKMEYDSRYEVYECPSCESKYENPQNDGILCCAVCGQAIDWSVEE